MASLLKISDATALGLHTMVYLSGRTDEIITTNEIAAFLSASEAHLAKVLQRLTKAGLIRSTRGPKGGFTVAEGAGETSLLVVYEAFEGPFPTGDCLFDAPVCNHAGCILGGILTRLGREFKEYLVTTTVAQLAEWRDDVTCQANSADR